MWCFLFLVPSLGKSAQYLQHCCISAGWISSSTSRYERQKAQPKTALPVRKCIVSLNFRSYWFLVHVVSLGSPAPLCFLWVRNGRWRSLGVFLEAHSRLTSSDASRGEFSFPGAQTKILECDLGHMPIPDPVTVFGGGWCHSEIHLKFGNDFPPSLPHPMTSIKGGHRFPRSTLVQTFQRGMKNNGLKFRTLE